MVCFTGTGIENAAIEIGFENACVQEREKLLK
ncbi:MAG: hypothetical protein HFJ86_06030 [Oscillospiraceae bacterium]|nr:hypothetical protein [Oscillospiraceae bacterium]